MPPLRTPYYLIDETKLRKNLETIRFIRDETGAKFVLALKCFSTWSVFDLMREYMDGTTSSSLFEARLGNEKFGKEVHAYSVVYTADEINEVREFAHKIIFNSVSQLRMFYGQVEGKNIGLRVNPGVSYSHFDLADPARKCCRLGVSGYQDVEAVAELINGIMFHFNCENDDVENITAAIRQIGNHYGAILETMEWVSLGGGIFFTKEGYPVDRFCNVLKDFSEKYAVQVYLEPGEAVITQTTELVTTVLDVVHNEIDIAIVDSFLEGHLLDHLIYRTSPKISHPGPGANRIMIAGRSCLAGDVFGTYELDTKLKTGDEVRVADAAGYTMVKKNWFNGLPMPSIVVRRLNGKTELIRSFGYEEFERSLS
jgi:carboxynorspermidine decarboxylase